MKLNWLLLLVAATIELVPVTHQEDHGLMLPELAVAEDGDDRLPAFDSQRSQGEGREENPASDGETRRVKGRTIKRRRRMRKRMRATTELPLDEQNEHLKVAEQNQELHYERRVVEDVTALPPVEESTRKRTIKRRRRPHRKNQDAQQENQGVSETGESETTKPPRRRRKGGRRRRPTTTESSKIELMIETTAIPPEPAEMTTAQYEVEKSTEIQVTDMTPQQLPEEDVGSIFQEEPDPQNYQVYDSRYNLVSQPSVDIGQDGNDAKYPEIRVEKPEDEKPHYSSDVEIPQYPHIEVAQPEEETQKYPSIEIRLPEVETQKYPSIEIRLPEEQNQQYPAIGNRHPDVETEEYQPTEIREPQVQDPEVSEIYSTVSIPNILSRLKPYSARPAVNTIKPVKEFIQESEPEQSQHHEERVNKEANEVPSQVPIDVNQQEPDYGNKIFDRKVLFSKSRKLPVTSAIIRKKLYPRTHEGQNGPSDINLGSSRDPSKNEVTEKQLIPEGFTLEPMTVEPSKLIERLKAHSKGYKTTTTALPTTIITTEEPNYPKFESKKEKFATQTENIIKTTTELYKNRFNKVVELHRSRGKVVFTTPVYESVQDQTTTNVQIVDGDTTEPAKVVVDVAPTVTQKAPVDKLNISNVNLNKLNDSIVELLQSESGKLSEILESRNMTLAQLLEHRERGSSRFQLSDFFASKKSLFGENSTASMNSDRVEIGTPITVEKQTISFPSQDVLGSFPAFMSDKIEGGVQTSKDEVITRKSVHLENREPRVFDSMPEFVDNKSGDRPPWKVVHPRLRPVSVKGNYEEIKIALNPLDNSKINEVDNPLTSDDKVDVLRTNRVTSTLEASVNSQDTAFGRFKKIPVTVKSAIIISIAILILAIFGFLSVLISCRMRQKKVRLRAKQDILCEHLKNEDFMNSQQSLSPVLTKPASRGAPPVFSSTSQSQIHSNTTSNRHYYLWRTLRKTFQYD